MIFAGLQMMWLEKLKNSLLIRSFSDFIVKLLIALVDLYKMTLSRYLGGNCRFVPSCSDYAILALKKYGALKGTFLALLRILRCNPLFKGGYDMP